MTASPAARLTRPDAADLSEVRMTSSDRAQSVHAYDKHQLGQKEMASPFDDQANPSGDRGPGATQDPWLQVLHSRQQCLFCDWPGIVRQ